MGWHLNEDISFCQLDAKLFFLDIQRDRYFQLSRALEHSFRRYLKAPDDVDVSELVKHNLLTWTSTPQVLRSTEPNIACPSQSVLETLHLKERVPVSVIRDVFINVCMMHWQLRTRRLKPILRSLSEYRYAHSSPVACYESEAQQHLAEAATAFSQVRPYVPVETCCLIDSLSMVRFLAKRGLHAQLVIGVACDPFSAHAWVQRGPLVLNETVGTAEAHVPIRVI
ncbi:lasso peptide biosynthesis B2 protein [Dyella sp.]|uniref:lasso peptide biosynthesis B2 protein n=1 Tax=Dyella sp. TaxID=1869338 RepID=UPI002D79EF59|nr:lasso peptide biosynthesis B2 protein [Dyella sp.]HET7331362.1 lasso peptide biosynthesis B2 protein [Dyella sp.]